MGATLEDSGLTHKYKTRLKSIAMGKCSSLFASGIIDEKKSFIALTSVVNVIKLFSSAPFVCFWQAF